MFQSADSSAYHAPPDRKRTIVDITCDSDGRVCKFVDLQDVKETLPLHRFIPEKFTYLGLLGGRLPDIMVICTICLAGSRRYTFSSIQMKNPAGTLRK